jgi:hypothetical protein
MSAIDPGWFTAWVDAHLSVSLCFVRPIEPAELLRELGAAPETAAVQTFSEAGDDPLVHRVRAGRHGGWTYAVEHFTGKGSNPSTLERLSRGGEAFALFYTPTVSAFLYAKEGRLLSGFDLTVPRIRYGSDQGRFDADIAAAGFLGPEPAGAAAGARLLHLLFGLDLEPEMLEGALLSAVLPDPW